MKIKRDAFLYFDSTLPQFAQCGTCWLFDSARNRCVVIPSIMVEAGDSCDYYGPGAFNLSRDITYPKFKPAEVGFVKRKVRCENCRWFFDQESECGLFHMLNREFPQEFELDPEVKPRGCCNAQVPK